VLVFNSKANLERRGFRPKIFDEELMIAKVVSQFQTFLPEAAIYVYNNRSTDDTVTEALKAGALVPGANS